MSEDEGSEHEATEGGGEAEAAPKFVLDERIDVDVSGLGPIVTVYAYNNGGAGYGTVYAQSLPIEGGREEFWSEAATWTTLNISLGIQAPGQYKVEAWVEPGDSDGRTKVEADYEVKAEGLPDLQF
jgi:hypothetical protein